MTERPERRSELARPAAAVLAVVAGLGCVLLGVTAVLAPATTVPTGAAASLPLAGAPPASVGIPELGLALDRVIPLGHVGGRREQPGTALGVGWFADGPAPGAAGVAVLSGHAGFGYSAGAFARLSTLRPGASITIRDDTGHETRFTVRRTALFPSNEPDSTLVTPEGAGPQLRLITSDGVYDGAGFSGARVAVYATPA
ncbi:class F sortase [Amycolatopsis sp. FBCC-B4732]|uniref:class F sortase n=1 Tax=Amycolatopsis sp. FBCC-B4732 TaxID=3079339 RepID=UPI001FF55768|nr:class F sortase [Amycolatopsis sp. FBCC-B4732]UOX92880.1 class F sortase [Amycolatopsis sp. FBCC-B4732]